MKSSILLLAGLISLVATSSAFSGGFDPKPWTGCYTTLAYNGQQLTTATPGASAIFFVGPSAAIKDVSGKDLDVLEITIDTGAGTRTFSEVIQEGEYLERDQILSAFHTGDVLILNSDRASSSRKRLSQTLWLTRNPETGYVLVQAHDGSDPRSFQEFQAWLVPAEFGPYCR